MRQIPAPFDSSAPREVLRLIRPRHREIMRRLVCGQTQREIAKDLNLSETRLSTVIRSPLFQSELLRMEADVRAKAIDKIGDVQSRIAKLQGPALDVLEGILKDKSGKVGVQVKRSAAMDIFDLAGAKKGKANDDGMNDFAQFISEAFVEAKARAFTRLDTELEQDVKRRESRQLPQQLRSVEESEADGKRDCAGEPYSVDEAEDAALIAATIDIEAETAEVEAETAEAEVVAVVAEKDSLSVMLDGLLADGAANYRQHTTPHTAPDPRPQSPNAGSGADSGAGSSLDIIKSNGNGNGNGNGSVKDSATKMISDLMAATGWTADFVQSAFSDPVSMEKLIRNPTEFLAFITQDAAELASDTTSFTSILDVGIQRKRDR